MKISAKEFIQKYSYLYFDPENCPGEFNDKHYGKKECSKKDYADRIKVCLNTGKLNGSDFYAEEEVIGILKKHTFNETALAWKSGKLVCPNGKCKAVNFDDAKNGCYINGYSGKIDKKAFSEYCVLLKKRRDVINEFAEKREWEKSV